MPLRVAISFPAAMISVVVVMSAHYSIERSRQCNPRRFQWKQTPGEARPFNPTLPKSSCQYQSQHRLGSIFALYRGEEMRSIEISMSRHGNKKAREPES